MKKLFTSVFLTLTLLTMSSMGTVFAQEATINGTVQSVTLGTDGSGQTTVSVSLLDDQGSTQTVTLSLTTATSLGLVTTDVNGVTTVNDTAIGTSVTINSTDVITPTEEPSHPVGSALSDFFNSLTGVDYDTIMSFHQDGMGFGVIAQALWMTKSLDGDSTTFAALLDAKKSGDFSNITLADGSTPDNWGDVVKSIKKGDNLGSVMSGKADASASSTEETNLDLGGHDKPDNSNGHGKPDKSNDNGNSNNSGNGNGHH